MTSLMLVKVAMIKRVRNLLVAHPIGYPQGDEVAAQFIKQAEQVDVLLTQAESGKQTRRASVIHRRDLRRAMSKVTLRHVLKVARLVAGAYPDVASGIKRPPVGKSEEAYLASVRAIVAAVEGQKGQFLQFGLSEEGLAELKGQVDAFQKSMEEGNAGLRAHTGGRAELRSLVKELMRRVQMLDGIIGLAFRDNAELLGSWQSARNVAWPSPAPAPAPETVGEIKPAA
jgi:hypothetical protein